MPLDFQTALAQYGFTQQLADSNWELKAKLEQAVREEWDSARFEAELKNTGWYKSQAERKRAIEIQKNTDPASWQQALNLKAAQISSLAGRLGLGNVNAGQYAEYALTYEWDDQLLQTYLVDQFSQRKVGDGLTGQAGEVEKHVRETFAQYGVPQSDAFYSMIAREVTAGRQTLGGMDNEARAYAKKLYPQFADQFEDGRTLADIAQPYMSTMANTLEVGAEQLTLNDPHVKRALQGKDGQPMALWEFERTLKDDARWQFTKQAKNETYAVLQQVGQDWGFQ